MGRNGRSPRWVPARPLRRRAARIAALGGGRAARRRRTRPAPAAGGRSRTGACRASTWWRCRPARSSCGRTATARASGTPPRGRTAGSRPTRRPCSAICTAPATPPWPTAGRSSSAARTARTHIGIAVTALFDSATETWTQGAPMAYMRWYPTVTTLGDGKVLSTSGDDANGDRILHPRALRPGHEHLDQAHRCHRGSRRSTRTCTSCPTARSSRPRRGRPRRCSTRRAPAPGRPARPTPGAPTATPSPR